MRIVCRHEQGAAAGAATAAAPPPPRRGVRARPQPLAAYPDGRLPGLGDAWAACRLLQTRWRHDAERRGCARAGVAHAQHRSQTAAGIEFESQPAGLECWKDILTIVAPLPPPPSRMVTLKLCAPDTQSRSLSNGGGGDAAGQSSLLDSRGGLRVGTPRCRHGGGLPATARHGHGVVGVRCPHHVAAGTGGGGPSPRRAPANAPAPAPAAPPPAGRRRRVAAAHGGAAAAARRGRRRRVRRHSCGGGGGASLLNIAGIV